MVERIPISKDTRSLINRLTYKKRYFKADHRIPAVKTPLLSEERRKELQDEAFTEALDRLLVHKLTMNKLSLDQRLTEPPSLIDRISKPTTITEVPASIPNNIHFRKSKILLRIKEFQPMIDAVQTILDDVFIRLNEIDKNEGTEIARQIPERDRVFLWNWWDRFQDISNGLEEERHKFTNAEWRRFRGAMKQIKGISKDKVDIKIKKLVLVLKHPGAKLP